MFSSQTEPSGLPDDYHPRTHVPDPHHHSIASLREAAEAKCPICITVAASLPREPISLSPNKRATSFRITQEGNELRVVIFINGIDSYRVFYFHATQVDEDRGNHDSGFRGLDLCYKWISDCLHPENPELHTSCRNHRTRSRKTLKRPFRIVQLRKEDGGNQLSYLVRQYPVDRELSSSLCYATVSHPDWTDNLEAIHRSSPGDVSSWTAITRLPACFRQAAQIAFAVGVQYIWIPGLCFSHHDEDPVGRAHIYAGGAFNIAAMACTKPADPLLPLNRETSTVPIVRPAWAPHRALAIYRSETFMDSVRCSPLWNAATFCQETLLSPATLYCARDQLWWQCFHGGGALCSEALAITNNRCRGADGQDGIVGQLKYVWSDYGLPKSFANFDPQPPFSSPETGSSNGVHLRGFKSFERCLAAMWVRIIAVYSRTKARTLEERASVIDSVAKCMPLLATPGAADYFASLSYAYGCWSADLVEQLAWHVDRDNPEGGRTFPYRDDGANRLPTWSWLSISESANFEFPFSTVPGLISTGMGVDTTYLSPVAAARFSTAAECNAIGGVATGAIRARGNLIPAKVELCTADANFGTLQLQNLGEGHVKWDCREEFDRVLERSDADAGDPYFAWPIFAHSYEHHGVLEARGVLLRQIEKGTVQTGVFVRCGWFRYSGQAGGPKNKAIADIIDSQRSSSTSKVDFVII
ncbi:hypothetical protein DL771_011974 [Monosporascus sp. 5C6A]|nr:hypothetical protein DL771_011974 [Monosporascus sp. 5C6A]